MSGTSGEVRFEINRSAVHPKQKSHQQSSRNVNQITPYVKRNLAYLKQQNDASPA
jgi:hypothetical protein